MRSVQCGRRRLQDDFYERFWPRLYRRIARELRSACRIVDIGCGGCELAELLAKANACREVIGVDVSDGSFPKRRNRRALRCVKADARSLDFFESGAVDAVVATSSLHEMDAPIAVLREARRILKPAGEILLVDFPPGSLAQRLWDEDYYSTGEVGEMLRRSGFERVTARRTARGQLTWARGFRPRRKGAQR